MCEKEAKTKAFSKEGLGAASRMDPKEKQKQDMRDWLGSVVDTLDTQVGHGDRLGLGWRRENPQEWAKVPRSKMKRAVEREVRLV